jgi:hypothetical protein
MFLDIMTKVTGKPFENSFHQQNEKSHFGTQIVTRRRTKPNQISSS